MDIQRVIEEWGETIQKYRQLGTVDELEELKEKDTPLPPTKMVGIYGGLEYECKNCGNILEISGFSAVHCHWCGQKLDWSK